MLALEIVRDLRTLHALRDEWNALVESAPEGDVICSHQWYECWARHFIPDDGMYVVGARDSGRLVALMPLMSGRLSRRGLGIKAIRSMTNRYSPVFDVISCALSEHVLGAMISRAFEISGTHVMLLEKVPRSSRVLECMDGACRAEGLTYVLRDTEGNWTVRIQGSFEEYFGSLKGKFRKNVRAAERKALERGPLTLLRPRCEEELRDILERGFTIEGSGWKGDHGTAVNQDGAARSFFFELAREFFDAGWLRVALLSSDGADLSFYFCVQSHGVIHALIIGANSDHMNIGPGIILTKRMLEDVFADTQSASWKFGGGADRWKRDFSKGQKEECFKVFVFRRGIIGKVLHRMAEAYNESRPARRADA